MSRKQEEIAHPSVNFNWNVFPVTRLEESQMSTPLGCIYSPFNSSNVPPQTKSLPISCTTCQAVLNPFIKLDRKNGMWWCPFCQKRTYLPESINIPEIATTVEDWPIEMRETSTTIDYELPHDIIENTTMSFPLTYYFVIDRYQPSEENSLARLLDSIVSTIKNIPLGSMIGIMTFNKSVQLHKINTKETVEISSNDISNCDKYWKLFEKSAVDQLLNRLGLTGRSPELDLNDLLRNEYLIELSENNIDSIINYILNIKPTYTEKHKPPRSTGLAHYVYSIMLSQSGLKNFIGKVLFFTSGACTEFPGKIVDGNSSIRSHKDIYDLEAPFFPEASKFYTVLSYIANGQSIAQSIEIVKSSSSKTTQYNIDQTSPVWAVNLYAGSLDQIGAYEMKPLITNTMGSFFLTETLGSYQIKDMIIEAIGLSHHKAVLEVSTSIGLKTSKLIFSGGYALPSSYHKSSKYNHLYHIKIDDELGEFDSPHAKKVFTNRWKFNELKENDTLSLFFKMESAKSTEDLSNGSISEVFIQFSLKFWDVVKKKWITRVTTVRKPTTLSYVKTSTGKQKHQSMILKEHKFTLGFDQRVWTILLTRLLINKIDTNLGYSSFDELVELIDRTIIKLLHYFGGITVTNNHTASSNPYYRLQTMYELNQKFKELPSLIYSLRKNSDLIKIFNSSPDETTYYHSWFLKMNMPFSIKVIEPVLINTTDSITRLPLDSTCFDLAPNDSFLILDTGFTLTLYYKCHHQNKLNLHPSDNDFMIENKDPKLPWDIIEKYISERQVIPRIVVTQTNHSQSRFLMSRLNPTASDSTKENQSQVDSNKGGFWSFWTSNNRKSSNLIAEDISLKEYYDDLIEQVQKFKI
ncbi:GTPase activating protein, putative [Candida dubliniensis CD36]|uniref:Protein transport protein SEC23 n=1 Tax=Candida dubliniensis (strain CD36 / ATCC MYA-646 / CBS 7987 / NCPF 3949 / NRRL Y-17841) TaxID=573826 RepID=B9WDH8_CANDC|nr:GTPase activating protein, putative [Candida dubliniensis CD36]CAX42734.1 GTPase activating protein, putative [Candida dubliniensis CD36]